MNYLGLIIESDIRNKVSGIRLSRASVAIYWTVVHSKGTMCVEQSSSSFHTATANWHCIMMVILRNEVLGHSPLSQSTSGPIYRRCNSHTLCWHGMTLTVSRFSATVRSEEIHFVSAITNSVSSVLHVAYVLLSSGCI